CDIPTVRYSNRRYAVLYAHTWSGFIIATHQIISTVGKQHVADPATDRWTTSACSLAFSLLGFTVEANYTFRMPSDQTPDHAMANMKGARRRDIVTTFDRLT